MTTRRCLWPCAFLAIVVLSASTLGFDSPSNTRTSDIETANRIITTSKLKAHLSFIASDELEGRDTPSVGLNLAARYIASHMEGYGYQPAGDNGTYYQKIPMTRQRISPNAKLKIQAGEKAAEFAFGTDCVARGSNANGNIVFAGYGLVSKQAEYDDYVGLEVRGKLVVVLDGFPEGMDPELFAVEQRFGQRMVKTPMNATTKPNLARQRGALGMIVIRDPEYTASTDGQPSPFQTDAQAALARETARLESSQQRFQPGVGFDLTADAGTRLCQALGVNLNEVRAKINETKKPFPVAVDATFDAAIIMTDKVYTQNVCAFLEGSDPQLKEEIVLFSAHYDHVGVLPPGGRGPGQAGDAGNDRIYNGADDDGSGTVGILNMAEAFAAVNRPRRSLLFIWHAGEEKGLWGSDYYVKNPTKPLDKIVTNINIDMIGRNSDDKPENANHLFVIGATRTSKELRDLVFKVNADRIRLDETDTGNFFMRSDHFNYAKNRIPVAFFFTGVHKDYHRVTDEVQLILFDKMKKVLDIIFECGLEVANRDTRPAFTGSGP